MSRCLVTGASGFVGPHLELALTRAGHEVWSSDRYARSNHPRYLACDLSRAESVNDLLHRVQPEAILHLASISSVSQSFAQPRETLLNNLTIACNLLEAVREHAPRARVLIVGSAEQYGLVRPHELPLRETQAFRPASPYAVSKVAQEFLALQYRATYDIDVVLTRSFNHSGPGQTDRFVLPSFARQIAEAEAGLREAVLHVGDLDVQRDFLDVRDVAQAYALLIQQGHSGLAYNVCRGESYRLSDLLHSLIDLARVEVVVESDPQRMRPADLPVLRGDPTQLREHTRWEPSLRMQDTLQDVLEDWRQRVAGGHSNP